MSTLLDPDGKEAVVGVSKGYWLSKDDFVSTKEGVLDPSKLGDLGFPRDWPEVYTKNAALKSLIGKKGSIPGKKVAVAGVPSKEDWSYVQGCPLHRLQSFANAEKAAKQPSGLSVVRGWAIFECHDRPVGEVFVAERYWWNALPDGRWVDYSPRPSSWDQLLLAEAAQGSPKSQSVLSAADLEVGRRLLMQRQPLIEAPKPVPQPATTLVPPATNLTAASTASVATSAPANRAVVAGKRTVPAPEKLPTPAASPAAPKPAPAPARRKGGLDYSKFNDIQDSDDDKPVLAQQQITLPYGMPREAVSREEYDQVWIALLKSKDLPVTPAPDLDQVWGYYKYGGIDEQALLDQACEFLGKFPCRMETLDYKARTYAMTKRLETEGREDEARLWSIIVISRFPKDPDAYYNQGVLLTKMCDRAKFSGAPTVRLPSLEGKAKMVSVKEYCSIFYRAAVAYYRRCLKVDPKQRPGYINLIGALERNEPSNWYDDVHELAAQAVRNGIWYNVWQRPPHFVPTLKASAWHDPQDFEMCRQLEEHFPTIKREYEEYMTRLINRKDWDDSDKTPGPSDVGGRPGALHDGGLAKSGSWREVPLFANCTLNREYAEYFPETISILQTHCRDATGLALCGGGDVIFSVLTPGSRLRPHCGPSNSRLTCHMGMRIPKTAEQGCRIRLAAEAPRGWTEGKCIVFDDSFEHEVIYEEAKPDEPYPGERVVLLANFWHPGFEFKNDPEWRQKSDQVMADVDVETLPQTAMMKVPETAPSPK